MSNEEETAKQPEARKTSRTHTMLWLALGLLVYLGIQWMLPKVGVSS
jgi:hypothetical protein